MWRNLFTKTRFLQTETKSWTPRRSVMSEEIRLPRVAVRNVPSEDRMQITFQYPADGKKRTFNFDRLKAEELEKTLARITTNVSKHANKKKKKKEKEKEEAAAEAEDVAVRLLNREDDVNGLKTNGDAWEEGTRLQIAHQRYSVQLNIPAVKSINLPDCLMAGFEICPRLSLEFASEDECKLLWFKELKKSSFKKLRGNENAENNSESSEAVLSDHSNEDSSSEEGNAKQTRKDVGNIKWSQIHLGHRYTPSVEDIGHLLKVECLPSDGHRHGDSVTFISKTDVLPGPGVCPFERRHQHTKELMPSGSFRFVSYNILADCYADSEFARDFLFPYCPPLALSTDYRRQLLLKELMGYNADIICLQEVDKKVFEYDLKPVLGRCGFLGLLKLKTGEVAEGTATFFRSSKFRIVEQYDLEMHRALSEDPLFGDIVERVSTSESLKEKLMQRTSVLQVTLLQSNDPDDHRYLLVATVHLYFHPKAPHIRTIQTAVCIRHIERVLEQLREQCVNPSVIFCGDLNAYPEAGVHEFLTTKKILAKHAEWYAGGKEEFVENMNLDHTLDLVSTCGFPRYTNYVGGYAGCLDYIYVDARRLRALSVVPMPSHEEVTENTALPNAVFPSDHIALVCNIGWKTF